MKFRLIFTLRSHKKFFYRSKNPSGRGGLLLVFCFILLFSSCVRKREPEPGFRRVFLSGETVGLHPVKSFQRKVKQPKETDERKEVEWFQASSLTVEDLNQMKAIQIRTASEGMEVKNSISQSGTFIDPNSEVSFIKPYYLLDYEILDVKVSDGDSPESVKTDPQKLLAVLLGKIRDFKGFPNTVYHIVPRVEGGWLVLYRVGPPETIPYDEHFVAIRSGDLMATPLVGYPIKHCRAKYHESDYGEIADVYKKECGNVSPQSSEAEYVQVTYTGKKKFEYKPKYDLYPADFFSGKWFYVRTVIRTSEAQSNAIGHQPFEPAHLITFERTSDGLKLVDASGDELQKEDRTASLIIRVEGKEYELDRDSERFNTFREREKVIRKDIDRTHFKILFDELKLWELSKEETDIKDVFVSDNYFSFNLEVHAKFRKSFTVKYAFKREEKNPGYPQKQWFERDSHEFFPVFFIERQYYKSILAPDTQEEKERFYRVTRFDPRSREIKWYLSRQTPQTPETDWIRHLGRQAIEIVNREFQEAGKHSDREIKITLAPDSETKELGDIRYNILNLIVTESARSGLLGYAPSVSHPITGEVLSATANIWVTNTLDTQYVRRLKEYIRFNIYPPPWKWKPSFRGVSDFMVKAITGNCPEVNRFIEREYKGPWFDFHSKFHIRGEYFDKEEEEALIGQCVRNLAKPYLLQLIVHEIRHGLGYRHIFSGSADEENYYTNYDEMKRIFGDSIPLEASGYPNALPKTASLMDYLVANKPILPVSGKCDTMATRFLYFDQVGLKEGKGFVDTSSGDKSILQAARAQGINAEDIKKCRVCGGRAPSLSGNGDIDFDNLLCRQWDYGSSPKEVVEYHIEEAHRVAHNSRRYDNENPPKNKLELSSQRAGMLKQFYQKWAALRDTLFDSSPNRETQRMSLWHYSSLISKDVEDYKEAIRKKAESPAQTESDVEFSNYYEVRQPIFDFFRELFFFPAKHCIYKKDGAYQAVSLDVIQTRIAHQYATDSREIIRTCQSPAVTAWVDDNDKGSFVAEVGYFVTNRSYFIQPRDKDKVDENSIFSDWISAVDSLFHVLDEPDFREEFLKELSNYFIQGLDLNPYVDVKDEQGQPVELDRALSYEAEVLNHPNPRKSVFYSRLDYPIRSIRHILDANPEASNEVRYELMSQYEFITTTRSFFQRMFGSVAATQDPIEELRKIMLNQNNEVNHPLLQDIYEDYSNPSAEEQGGIQDFISFVLNHSLVYSKPGNARDQRLFIPFAKAGGGAFDENSLSLTAQVIGKLREYWQCVDDDNRGRSRCENKESKDIYVDMVHHIFLR